MTVVERPLCVLQILPALEAGGVERGSVEISEALVRAGHRSLVISGGGSMAEEITAQGGEHRTLPVGRKSLFSLTLIPALRRLLREESVDILHARSRWPAWLAWLAWRGLPAAARPGFVTTVHGFYSVNAYSAIMTRGQRVICVSEAIREYVLKQYPGVDPSRLERIHRGIDRGLFPYGYNPDDAWRLQWEKAYPNFRGRKLLLLPGRITRRKGHHDFISLIAGLRTAGRDVHGLILGGEDPNRRTYAGELRQAINRAGLAERITMLGARADVREIMAVSDLVLSLSTQPESFGRTTLEALSLGRPVLGYSHGGVEEILTHLYPAGLSPVADRQALIDNALQLLDQPQPVTRSDAFTLVQMQSQTLSVYQQLAARKIP